MDKTSAIQWQADENKAGYGQPLLIGARVRAKVSMYRDHAAFCDIEPDGTAVGVVDRVDMSTGDLFVWFGKVTEIGNMKIAPPIGCDLCELEQT